MWEAGSSPTKTTAKPGAVPTVEENFRTLSISEARISAAIAFPSMIVAAIDSATSLTLAPRVSAQLDESSDELSSLGEGGCSSGDRFVEAHGPRRAADNSRKPVLVKVKSVVG